MSKRSNQGIVRVVAVSAGALGGCWLIAFGGAYGADLPLWAFGLAALVVAAVAAFGWFLSKIAHGGDWARQARKAERGRVPSAEPAIDQAALDEVAA